MSRVRMKTVDSLADPSVASANGGASINGGGDRPLHRIREVRKQQNISVRRVARRMKTDVHQVRSQEDPWTDMPLSTLYEWQRILDVPVVDLLVDLDAPLSAPVLKRTQMLRLMKTAVAMVERTKDVRLRRMAQMMVDQLTEIMPELGGVSPWHETDPRRTTNAPPGG